MDDAKEGYERVKVAMLLLEPKRDVPRAGVSTEDAREASMADLVIEVGWSEVSSRMWTKLPNPIRMI